MKIYTKFGKQDTIKEFLAKFFSYNTSYILKSVETFKDETCTIQQEREGLYRSVDDLYICVKTYYSDITYKDLIYELLTLNINYKNDSYVFCPIICDDINKNTSCFIKPTGNLIKRYYNNDRDERKSSSVSWVELCKMLKIINKSSYNEFRLDNPYVTIKI